MKDTPNVSKGGGFETSRGRLARSVSLSAMMVAFALVSFILFQKFEVTSERRLAQASAKRAAADLAQVFAAITSKGSDLQGALAANNALSYDAVKSMAQTVLASDPAIEGVSIAPGAVVKYHFPEKDNKIFIGHDLLTNPERRDSLIGALSSKGPMVSGPSESVDFGEVGFVRYPVAASGQKPWGFINLMFDFRKVMEEAKLGSSYPEFSFALAKETPLGTDDAKLSRESQSLLVWGDSKAYSRFPVIEKLAVPGSNWSLCAIPRGGWSTTGVFAWILFVEALMSGVFLFLALGAARVPRKAEPKKVSAKNKAAESVDTRPTPGSAPELADEFADKRDGNQFSLRILPDEEFDFPKIVEKSRGRPIEFKGPAVQGEVYMPEKARKAADTPEPLAAPPVSEAPGEPKATYAQASPASADPRPKENNKVVGSPRRNPEILVVDDGEASREILSRMLSARGYSADMASAGPEAIDLCRKKEYDFILMDCFMPNMDGFAASALVRELYGNRRVPIVGMSARVDQREREHCAAAGMDGLLAKPFTLKELMATLAAYLPEELRR